MTDNPCQQCQFFRAAKATEFCAYQGELHPAVAQRSENGLCGPEGILFQPRRIRRSWEDSEWE